MWTLAICGLQLLLLLVAGVTFARRARWLLLIAPLDRRPFISALQTARDAQQPELARAIARAAAPAWASGAALLALAAPNQAAARAVLDEQRLELEHSASSGLGVLRSLARMAAPLSFLGIIGELGHALSGGSGLQALSRGLPLKLALEHSLTMFALGLGGTIACATAAAVLRRAAIALLHEAADLARLFERSPAPAPSEREG